MLFIAFTAIFYFKKAQIKDAAKWPEINCPSFIETFGSEEIKAYAGLEYNSQVRNDWNTTKSPMTGSLECYC